MDMCPILSIQQTEFAMTAWSFLTFLTVGIIFWKWIKKLGVTSQDSIEKVSMSINHLASELEETTRVRKETKSLTLQEDLLKHKEKIAANRAKRQARREANRQKGEDQSSSGSDEEIPL